MIHDYIRERLFSLQDIEYQQLQLKICTTASEMIGVRTPELKKLANELSKREDTALFLDDLPHRYFEEDQLHAFITANIKDMDVCMDKVCRFLPYVNNWATCDQLCPKVFARHKDKLLGYIYKWIESGSTYEIRFAVKMLMSHFLDEDYDIKYPELVAHIHSDEYYVRMMIAWYFATALAKQYDTAIKFIEEKRLDEWVHNKAISKATESFRVSDDHKEYLKTLRIKKNNK